MFSFRGHSSGSDSRFGAIARLFLRFLQIVFAITVAGLYGTDIDSERKVDGYDKSKWVRDILSARVMRKQSLTELFCSLDLCCGCRIHGRNNCLGLHDTANQIMDILRLGLYYIVGSHIKDSLQADDGRMLLILAHSILWVAVFGVFGKIYIDEEPDRLGIQRMRNAVWIDLINMLLWFISTVYGVTMFIRNRRHMTLHTGRATA